MAQSKNKALLSVGDRIRYNIREWTTELEVIKVGILYYHFKVIQTTFKDHKSTPKRGYISYVDGDIRREEFIVIKNHGVKRAIKRINRVTEGKKQKGRLNSAPKQ